MVLDGFDFSVNEECHEFDECGPCDAFIEAGKPVFNAEYRDEYVTDAARRVELCSRAAEAGIRTLVCNSLWDRRSWQLAQLAGVVGIRSAAPNATPNRTHQITTVSNSARSTSAGIS